MSPMITLSGANERWFFYFFCWACAMITLVACSGQKDGKKSEKSGQQALVADVVVLKGQNLANDVYTTGTLLSNEAIELKAPVAGTIMELVLREGAKVKKGQKLVQLDDREWRAQLQRYEAQLNIAEKNLERNRTLLDINGVSQEIVDQAEANVASLKANIAEVKVKIDQASVDAPFDGSVGLKSVSVGEFVTVGTSMAALVQNNPIKLDFSLPGKYAHQLRPGQNVEFSVDGIRDTLDAQVYAIEPQLDATSRTIRVRAKADNSEGRLFPGAFANVKVTLDNIPDALVVPTEAVIPELNAQKVFKIKSGKAFGQNVGLGIRTGKFVEITDGVMDGDTIMVTGLLQVREEMPVHVGEVVNN